MTVPDSPARDQTPCEEPDCALHDAPEPVAAYLANIHSDLDGIGPRKTEKIRDEHAPRLLAAVEAALKRHAPTGAFPAGSDVCTECGIERDVPWSWPCPTIKDISAALLGKENGHG